MNSCVLDASAVLALLNQEQGADIVEGQLPGAIISTVNLAEIVGKLTDAGMPETAISSAIEILGLELVDFDFETAFAAGTLRATTQALGLSLGDRFCLALAKKLNLPAFTADKRWRKLDIGVTIHLIR